MCVGICVWMEETSRYLVNPVVLAVMPRTCRMRKVLVVMLVLKICAPVTRRRRRRREENMTIHQRRCSLFKQGERASYTTR